MKPNRLASVVSFTCFVLLNGMLAGTARSQNATVAPSDDAYHFESSNTPPHATTYTEWWYFNFIDPTSGVQGILSYFIENPADRLGAAQVRMVAVAYTEQGIVSVGDNYPVAAFAASNTQADVTIGDCTVRVIDEDTYRVTGASKNGRLAWDLIYSRQAEPWFAADRMNVGHLPWEQMSWLIYMPRAQVLGRFVVDGREYAVDGPGYNDHNWGEWIPTDALWNWAQYSSSRVAFEMGVFIGAPVGAVSIEVDGVRSVFAPGQFQLIHTRWAYDAARGVFYPTQSRLTATNGTARLAVDMRVSATEPLVGDLPLPLKNLIVYEQPTDFQGGLWSKGRGGTWVPSVSFAGQGFKEYTAKHY